MSILTSVVELVAGDALIQAAEGAKNVVEKASDKAEQMSQKRIAAFLSKNPTHAHLFLHQQWYTWKESYQIFDAQQQVKYIVKGELLSRKHHLHIYDASGRQRLGTIKEKLIALRSPLSMESHPMDFVIEVGGTKLGKVKSKWAFGKSKFEVTFNDWQIEGDFWGKGFKVISGNDLVMEVSREYAYKGDMYFMDITDPKNEFMCLLVMLALDAASMSKKDETKRTARKKRLL